MVGFVSKKDANSTHVASSMSSVVCGVNAISGVDIVYHHVFFKILLPFISYV